MSPEAITAPEGLGPRLIRGGEFHQDDLRAEGQVAVDPDEPTLRRGDKPDSDR